MFRRSAPFSGANSGEVRAAEVGRGRRLGPVRAVVTAFFTDVFAAGRFLADRFWADRFVAARAGAGRLAAGRRAAFFAAGRFAMGNPRVAPAGVQAVRGLYVGLAGLAGREGLVGR